MRRVSSVMASARRLLGQRVAHELLERGVVGGALQGRLGLAQRQAQVLQRDARLQEGVGGRRRGAVGPRAGAGVERRPRPCP